MDTLNIDISSETPRIILDKEKNIMEMAGNSIPEDAQAFYDPILEWIDNYLTSPNPKTNFVFKLEYFNTASSKLILDILFRLKSLNDAGNDVTVRWYHEENDMDMLLAAKTYVEITDLKFEFVETEFDF